MSKFAEKSRRNRGEVCLWQCVPAVRAIRRRIAGVYYSSICRHNACLLIAHRYTFNRRNGPVPGFCGDLAGWMLDHQHMPVVLNCIDHYQRYKDVCFPSEAMASSGVLWRLSFLLNLSVIAHTTSQAPNYHTGWWGWAANGHTYLHRLHLSACTESFIASWTTLQRLVSDMTDSGAFGSINEFLLTTGTYHFSQFETV